MDVPEAPDEIETVARRIDFLERLQDGPLHKPEMVESMDHSRSTVDRAIRRLEEAGFVERATDGYVTTVAGRLAAERYRSFLDDQRSILGARDLLSALPSDCSLPVEVLSAGEVRSIDRPYDLFEIVGEELRTADHYRAVLPRIVDSRHVRLCHDRTVRGDLDAELAAPGGLLARLREEFPALAADLVDTGAFRARRVDPPAYGLLLAGRGGDPIAGDADAATVLLVIYGDDGVAGVARTDARAAVAWARERYRALVDGAADATDRIAPRDDAGMGSIAATPDRLPPALRSEGFVAVTDRYFDRVDPLDPARAWRVGVGLPEARAGYAVGRTPTREGPATLADDLTGRLRDGDDLALVGPPGAGKSTVCKRVACRWVDDGGTVFYREGDADRTFESTAVLEDALLRAQGPVLVVVEDAVRSDAYRVLETMRSIAGRDDVRFLLDAREAEWQDPEPLRSEARLDAFRRERVDPVSIPGLSPADCERIVEEVEAVVGDAVDVRSGDLLADLDDGEEATPATAWLLFDRLARYLDPLECGPGETTSLDEDVDRVRADLASIGDVAADVGLLVNLWNAAGLSVFPEYAHALATEDGAHDEVRAALDRLEGHALFDGDRSAAYETVHGAWSARYLERSLAADGEAAVRRRAHRVLAAVLRLTTDADRREAAARATDGEAAAIDRVLAAPTEWADETVAGLFELGREHPSLAPLYEAGDDLDDALEAACSPDVVDRTVALRGRIFLAAGRLERATAEFERLADHDDDHLRIEGLLGRCTVARRRDDLATATDLADTVLSLAGDERCPARARANLELGRIELRRSEYDDAERHLEAALDVFEDVGLTRQAAKAHSELGTVALRQSDYEGARSHYDQSRSRYQAVGDRRGEAQSLADLGDVAHRSSNYDAAREHYLRALEVARELGAPTLEATCLKSLGNVAYVTRDLDTAEEYYREGLAIAEDLETDDLRRKFFCNLGNVTEQTGDVHDAIEYHRRHLELDREAGDDHGQAIALTSLSIAATRLGETERAIDRATEAVEHARAAGSRRAEASALVALGHARVMAGDLEDAREPLETALEIATEIERPRLRCQASEKLAGVDCWTGALDAAERRLEDAPQERAFALELRARIAFERRDLEAAEELFVDALEAHREHGDAFGTVSVGYKTARMARRRGRLDRAESVLDDVADAAAENDSLVLEDLVRLERCAIAAKRGRESLEADLDRVIDSVERNGSEIVAIESHFERGLIERERGDLEAARDALERSFDRADDVGATPVAARAASHLGTICDDLGDEAAATRWRSVHRDLTTREAEAAAEAASVGEEKGE